MRGSAGITDATDLGNIAEFSKNIPYWGVPAHRHLIAPPTSKATDWHLAGVEDGRGIDKHIYDHPPFYPIRGWHRSWGKTTQYAFILQANCKCTGVLRKKRPLSTGRIPLDETGGLIILYI